MMDALKFEKINGHVPITSTGHPDPWFAYCICDCGKTPWGVRAYGDTESAALKALLVNVLQLHGRIVMGLQGWKCHNCGQSSTGLEADHIVRRSKGRDDRVSNLQALCASFTGCRIHQQKHGG